MAPAASWTVGLLKPDIAIGFKVGVGPDGRVEAPPGNGKIVDDVLQRIKDEGFVVEAKRLVALTRMQVREMMRDCWEEPTFDDTLAFMTSGPCMALLLGRDQAVEHWNSVMGPADPAAAKKVAGAKPPLRALHGSSLLRNAFYGSATATCALRDKNVLFPPARPSMERSLVLLKPSATCFLDAISALFEMHALYVLDQIDTVLDDDDVALIAAYPDDDAYMSELGSVAKGGRSRVLILEGLEVTTKVLALLLGPLDLLEAKQYFPESIRAHMGSSLVHNVLDVLSPSPSALTKWFPGFAALLPEKTYAMIKPGASPETIAAIQARIRLLGFDILAEATQHWSREDAMAFYAEHEGKAFFPTLIAYMSSGPIVAMMLSRVKAIAMWRKCMGPTNSAAARASSPQSLRARFGIDGTKNATHGSDSSPSALRELRLVFKTPLRSLAPLKCNVLAQQLGTFQAETMTLHDTLAKGLTLLCQVQPQLPPLDAAEWLGKYLIRQALHRDESEGNNVCSYDAPSSSSALVDVAQPKDLLVPSLSSLHLVAFYGPSPQRAAMATAMATQYKYLYMDLALVLEKAPPGLDLIAVLLKAFKRCTSKRVILDNCPADLSFYLAFQKVVAEFAWVVYVSDDGAFAPSPEELDFFDLFQRFGQLHIAKAAPSSSYLLDVHDAFAPTLVFVQESPRAALSTAQWRAIGVHHGWTILDWDDVVRAELKREARRSQSLLRPFIETGEQIPQQQLLALFDASVTGHRCLLLHLPAYTRNKAFMCALQRRVGATPHPLVLFLDTEPMESASMGAFEKQCFGLGRLYHQWLPGPTSVAHLCTVLAPLLAPAIGILAMDAPWAKDAARLRGYTVLNVKDVLRAEVLKRSLDGETIAALVARSEPVPDALVLAVLQRYMAQKQNRRVLLDEFPQTSAQAASMLRVLASAPAFVLQAASETLVPEAVAPLAAGAAIVTITGPNDAALSTTLCQWSISIVLGDFDLSDVEISALQARLPRHLVLHMDEVAASMQEYASDDVVKLLCFLLQRRLGKQILLVGFPRSLAEAEQFEATGSVIENVFVLHRKVLAVSHEPTDEDYYSSDEEDRARKKSAPEPEFDKLLRHFAGPRLRAFTFVQLHRVYEPICNALRPRVVLAIGHELLAPLTLAVATSHRAVHLHVPHLLEAHARAFSTPASVQDSALVAQLLRDALCRSGAQVVVVTGYPRVVGATKPYVQEQLSIITAAVGPLRKLLHLTCSATTLLERCGGDMRLVHGRTDEFAMEFAPLLHYCRRNQTLPVAEISADRSTEAVAAALRSHVAE